MTDDLDLLSREGLPEALRTLLADYPRTGWQAHANFAGLVEFWLDRHMMFRRLCELLRSDAEQAVDGRLDPQAMQGRLSRYGGMLVQQLHGHHQIEDMHYFPVLVKRETRLERGFEILDRDHHALDGLLERFTRSANGVLQAKTEAGAFREEVLSFEGFLNRHLEDEEDLIVPVILRDGSEGLNG
ncbi:hemerythrin domain-containing protein [Ponticoccus gilvus]|nr:hemerythrin domain-containing protein [Enemella evansiae]